MAWRGARVRLCSAAAAGLSSLALCRSPVSAERLERWSTGERPSILIKYFDAKGVMETTRVLLVLAAHPFRETRWPLDVSKMVLGLEAAAPEYTAAKECGELDMNLGRGPVLLLSGGALGGEHVLAQSRSIERYLARQLGMMGDDELTAAHVDAFTEHLRDLKEKYQKMRSSATAADKEARFAAFYSTTLPEFMLHVEKTVPGGEDGALFGGRFTLADAALFVTFNDYFDNKAAAIAALDECPKLLASWNAVRQHPAVAQYLATRPDTKV